MSSLDELAGSQMNLEQELLDDLSRQWNRESNRHITRWFAMHHLEKDQGWTRVEISRLQDNHHAVDITMWLHDLGLREDKDYLRDGREFLFKRSEDATVFTLRWA